MSFNIERIAELANLRLNESEYNNISNKIDGILAFVETITDLDLEGQTPAISSYELPTVLRDDVVGTTLSPQELAVNVPKLDDSAIIVPQVIQR